VPHDRSTKVDPSATPVVLAIAGSDCSGGAGIQADIKTGGVFGVHVATAITALTAQNSDSVSGIYPVQPSHLLEQLESISGSFKISAVKLGMVASVELAATISAWLKNVSVPIVIDPVLSITSDGTDLSSSELQNLYLKKLLPISTVFTPNIHEASRLLSCPCARNYDEMVVQAQKLLSFGCENILMKAGHLGSGTEGSSNSLGNTPEIALESLKATDVLVDRNGDYPYSGPRIDSSHTHGGGCSMATAIAAGIAQGLSVKQAVAAAKSFIQGAIAHAHRLGLNEVNGPVHHFYNSW